MIFLPRHGRGHRLTPSELNFRANIWGLKSLGAEWVISISAVGSMKEAIHPLDLVIPDQFFDATKPARVVVLRRRHRGPRGHGRSGVPGRWPTRSRRPRAAASATVQRGGTYICIEGPQFSTKAESRIYRGWGVDVIGMTNMPEAKLAREAELCYATLALVTDYDVWHETPRDGDGGGGDPATSCATWRRPRTSCAG